MPVFCLQVQFTVSLNKLSIFKGKVSNTNLLTNELQYCISDNRDKTATGTIAIQVEDFNDHCPTLTSASQLVCFQDNVVYATAVDGDAFPNGAPFEFKVASATKEQWTVERLNGENLHRVTVR